MHTLAQLKSFDPSNDNSLEDMVFLLSSAIALGVTYEHLGMEVPEWVTEASQRLKKEIETRSRDALERELKEIEGREEALKSNEQKRNDLASKRERIKAKLAKAPVVAA